jgi:hypothetical protein
MALVGVTSRRQRRLNSFLFLLGLVVKEDTEVKGLTRKCERGDIPLCTTVFTKFAEHAPLVG